jgi:hypothetical protein
MIHSKNRKFRPIKGLPATKSFQVLLRNITEPKTLKHSPKTYSKDITLPSHRERNFRKKTHSHLSNSALDVFTERISGAPASVTLKSVSVTPFQNSQVGVISDESHFMVGLSVSTKLRNDSEKDFPNVVILFNALALRKKKKKKGW